ncbi:MAG TPA: c-type cytochrome [Gammaproteobacteria bacterium]|nr:c-type cytochrome [Gammaproteobacteria bacterium]
MSSGFREALPRALLAGLLVSVVIAPAARSASPVSVCVDRSSPSAHIDRIAARRAAAHAGLRIRIVRFDSDHGLGAGQFRKLAKRRCDLIMGFPVEAGSMAVPAGLEHTAVYLDTGFVLLSRKGWHLDALPRGSQLGVSYQSPPDQVLSARTHRFRIRIFNTESRELAALAAGRIDAAAVWQPTYWAYRQRHRVAAHWKANRLGLPHASWGLAALYSPRVRTVAARFADALEHVKVPRPGPQPGTDASSGATTGRAPGQPRLYTAGQARAGARLFVADCARCHGADLQGISGPPLKGATLAGPDADLTVGDIFGILSQRMPMGAPGSLSRAEYTRLMAFLLRENGFPPGGTPLRYTQALASKVPLAGATSETDVASDGH